jgi:TetR/AcrR family transcriptional regulator
LAWKNAVLAREDQRERKREVLLREAAALINKRGFHATSLEEIAIGLGVTKTALYYYFPNKQKLLSACMDRVMKVAFEAAEEAKARGATGREKLMLALQLYLEKLIDEMSCCVIVSEESSMPPEDRIAHQKQRDKYDTIIRNLVKEGIKDGSIVPCDPKLVTFTLLGAVHWVPKWFSHEGEWTSAQLSHAMMELFERALSAKPAAGLVRAVADWPDERRSAPEPAKAKAGRTRRR